MVRFHPPPRSILLCWNTDKTTGKTEWTFRYCPEIASNISIMQLLTFPELQSKNRAYNTDRLLNFKIILCGILLTHKDVQERGSTRAKWTLLVNSPWLFTSVVKT